MAAKRGRRDFLSNGSIHLPVMKDTTSPKTRERPTRNSSRALKCWTYAQLAGDTATLPQGRRSRIDLPLAVRHEVEDSLDVPLTAGRADSIEPIRHTIDFVVEARGDHEPAAWDVVAALPHIPVKLDQQAGQIAVIGRLTVEEYPLSRASCMERPIYEWIGEHDGGLESVVYAIANDERDDYQGELIDGSLFWYRELHVHPAVRGQRLGARLLAHALLALSRTSSDVTILEAAPVLSIYAPTPNELRPRFPPQPPESMTALVRYYSRLGFRHWDPTLKPTDPFGSIMWHPGWAQLPFHA